MVTVVDSSLFHPMKEGPAQPWSIHLKSKRFTCTPLLAKQLNFNSPSVPLSQFFNLFESTQSLHLKQSIKQACEQGRSTELRLVLTIDKQRYLAQVEITADDKGAAELVGKLKILQKHLSQQQEMSVLRKLFDEAKNGLMVADTNHHILMVNQEFCRETEYTESELLGTHAGVIKSAQYDAAFYQKLWHAINEHQYWEGELLATTKSGGSYAHEALIQSIELGNDTKVYATTTRKIDVSMATLSHNQLSEPQIQLPNKAAFEAALEVIYQRLPTNRTLVCIAFNADMSASISPDMKAWLISQRFDSIGFDGFLGQISSSMFGLCWDSEKKVDIINSTLWSVIRRLVGTRKDDALKLAPVLTVGCSVLALDAAGPKQLLSHAIQALIANQQMATPTLYYFDRRLTQRFDRVTVLTKLLNQAIEAEKVEVYYQPIVSLPDLKVVKFEALFRANLATELEYNTQELIQIAEKNRWIDKIDNTVARQAIKDLRILQRHFNNPHLEMSINRSLHNDLLSRSCLEETLQLLIHSDVNLDQITLELTESAFFQDLDRQKMWIEKLSQAGIKIAIDDFGTGYSSFSYLLNLPVSIVKIDKLFVDNVAEGRNEQAMIDMLTTLTHKMNGKVIVEGVESIRQLNMLSRLKVDMLQGYLFSKPKSLADLLEINPANMFCHLASHVYRDTPLTAISIMATEFITVGLDDRLAKLKTLFERHSIQHLVVIENSQCQGIVDRAALYEAISPYLNSKSEQQRDTITLNKRAHQIMNSSPTIMPSTATQEECHQWLLKHPHDMIIVTGSVGVCVGVITSKELLESLQPS